MLLVFLHTVACYLCCVAYFSPFFETPYTGTWVLSDYPLLLGQGILGIYLSGLACGGVSVVVYCLFVLLGFKKSSLKVWFLRFLYFFLFALGAIGSAGVMFMNKTVMSLFFGNLVDAKQDLHNSYGFYALLFSFLLSSFASFFSLFSSFDSFFQPSTKITPTSKRPQPNTNNTTKNNQTKQQNQPTGLRSRKKGNQQQQQEKKKNTSHNSKPRKKKSTANRKQNSEICFVLLHVVVIAAFGYFIVSVNDTSVGLVDNPLGVLTLPPGFKLHEYCDYIKGARSLAMGDKGVLFVGTRQEGDGNVYAVLDLNNDFVADKVIILEQGLYMPNGVAFKDGSLYLAEVDKLWKFDDIESKILRGEKPTKTLVRSNWPSDSHHGWKFIAFGPDGYLYVPIGAPCNVCERKDARYGSIMKINISNPADDSIFAYGIRNSVGFAWHPETKHLWFTENGRDFASEDFPPDELNVAPVAGLHFGYPYCFGDNVPDPETNKGHNCSEFTPSVRDLEPHVAALGMRFYTGNMFPEDYKNSIIFAEHGSWNRKKPTGYRVLVSRLSVSDSGKYSATYEPFLTGFINENRIVGRPVDVLELEDGSVLVSDDFHSKIYRITYTN